MNDVGVIDTFLNTFTSYIDSGFGLIKGEVTGLSSILIALDITLAGLFWAWGADEDVMRRLVRKTLAIGFFAWIIGNFNSLSKIVFESFAGLGLKAGGSAISTAEFLRPGRLAEVGLTAAQPLLDAASQLAGPVAIFVNAVQIAVLLVSWLLILIAFFILAVQLFVTLIEFKLTTLAGFVLIPFAFFGKTAFLAEKVLGNIVASGVKVMVLAVIIGIGSGLFSQFTTSYGDAQPTISQALAAVLAALALLGLGIFGPGIATGLITGAPQLGAGAAVGTGLAAGGMALAGAGAAGLAVRGAGAVFSGAAAAARAGASLAGGAASAYSAGAAGQSGLSGVGSGLGGVARAAGAAATSPLQRSADTSGEAAASSSGPAPSSNPASSGDAPDWARRMRRSQQVAHGIQTATHAVRSGDSHGGGSSISLSESDRP
ncbi:MULTISPECIES: P-type conjugative transfer protein TrbL [Xanthobacteraceae]|jgi:type IV secretion system protein TrbL|uniref:P-type conjugative transfer protein TrbL n=2 Tax=Xanthobacter TaxID=279 RepID=A7IMH4_XANP2|nr:MULTISPECIES: P-type conjugative transfer protein TrbL [Xanthobacter]ABS69217.1 P-type conjugative transfer protein TrbL [Xanthobacter autotrophicus Py2]MBP2147504.1 type IV secretion system protein TrbL [Xanthobacter flavus]MCG5237151.1 P-type conjugative transfer protein TrbL [Xanthobacter oligotrophicus]MDI4662979.1 P-type conjugative transfer protein TrbL [Xanthobacter autotrophicus]MDR6331568.1 type IV secretion system protein TrbL [Xanthobacter flavus]